MAKRGKRHPVLVPDAGRTLALDVSSTCVGWAVFEQGKLTHHGRFMPPGKSGTHGAKLAAFRTWLLALLAEFRPEHLVYEKPYPGRMKHAFGVLCRYIGVVEACHMEFFGVELPQEDALEAKAIKRAIGAKRVKGHENNKLVVVKLVNAEFGLRLKFKADERPKKISQDDEADAIAVGWAWHLLRE